VLLRIGAVAFGGLGAISNVRCVLSTWLRMLQPDEIRKDTDPLPLERQRADRMDSLTAFGLFAVTAMLVTYALEHRTSWFILAFAGACALGSAYGFLQGAWPFGLVEAIWALVALRRWWLKDRGRRI
jgi:hypothetical protein